MPKGRFRLELDGEHLSLHPPRAKSFCSQWSVFLCDAEGVVLEWEIASPLKKRGGAISPAAAKKWARAWLKKKRPEEASHSIQEESDDRSQ